MDDPNHKGNWDDPPSGGPLDLGEPTCLFRTDHID